MSRRRKAYLPLFCPHDGKIVYGTEAEAQAALASARASGLPGRQESRYYRHDYCGAYHLTAQSNAARRERVALPV